MARHEHAGAALVGGTLAPQPVDFPVLVHLETQDNLVSRGPASVRISDPFRDPSYLVVFEHSQLDLLPLVLVLLGGRVRLLLPLFGSAPQPENQVQRGLLRRRTCQP